MFNEQEGEGVKKQFLRYVKMFGMLVVVILIQSCSINRSTAYKINRVVAAESGTQISDESCSRLIFSILKETYYNNDAAELLRSSFYDLSQDAAFYAGAKTPGWHEIDALERSLQAIYELNKRYQFPTDEDRADFIHRIFYYSRIDIKKFVNEAETLEPKKEFNTTEYELITLFRQKFEEFNSYLPTNKRLILKPIPENLEFIAKLTKNGEEIIVNQKKMLDEYFKTTGYENYDEYLEVIKTHRTEIGEKLVDAFLNDTLELTMRRPENARWWVPKVGLHNQYATGSSRGSLDYQIRHASEASLTGIELDKYSGLSNYLKPKYGYVSIDKKSSVTDTQFFKQYGEDIYTFKKENVKNRTSWVKGNCLYLAESGAEELNDLSRTTPTKWGPLLNRPVYEIKSWDFMFLPWDKIALAIPFMQHEAAFDKFLVSNEIDKSIFNKLILRNKTSKSTANLEFHIWGPVRLSDVQDFTFTNNEPTGEFLQELLRNNVKIFDGRRYGELPIEWVPPTRVPEEFEKIPVNEKTPTAYDVPIG